MSSRRSWNGEPRPRPVDRRGRRPPGHLAWCELVLAAPGPAAVPAASVEPNVPPVYAATPGGRREDAHDHLDAAWSRPRLLAVPALLVGASTPTADAATADHRRPFTREVEPWIPGSPPSTPPAVKLTAACVRRVGARGAGGGVRVQEPEPVVRLRRARSTHRRPGGQRDRPRDTSPAPTAPHRRRSRLRGPQATRTTLRGRVLVLTESGRRHVSPNSWSGSWPSRTRPSTDCLARRSTDCVDRRLAGCSHRSRTARRASAHRAPEPWLVASAARAPVYGRTGGRREDAHTISTRLVRGRAPRRAGPARGQLRRPRRTRRRRIIGGRSPVRSSRGYPGVHRRRRRPSSSRRRASGGSGTGSWRRCSATRT